MPANQECRTIFRKMKVLRVTLQRNGITYELETTKPWFLLTLVSEFLVM